MSPVRPTDQDQPESAATINSDRRRPGRREYENAHLISLLRDNPTDLKSGTEPEPQSRYSWRLVVLATVVLWAGVFLAAWLW
jgi:hypothetical protein